MARSGNGKEPVVSMTIALVGVPFARATEGDRRHEISTEASRCRDIYTYCQQPARKLLLYLDSMYRDMPTILFVFKSKN